MTVDTKPRLLTLALITSCALCACGDDTTTGGAGGAGGSGGAVSNGGSGGGGTSALTASVRRYDLSADLEAATASLALTLDVSSAGNCFTIPSEVLPSAARFDDVEAASLELVDNQLTVCSAAALAEGSHLLSVDLTLTEQTFHNLDVGYSTTPNLAGGSFTYLLSWVGGCDHFGPCDDDPAAFAEFSFDVRHPSGTTVLCPGAITPSATQTRCELVSPLAPTYSAFSFAADTDWVGAPLVSAAGTDVVLFEAPGGTLRDAYDVASLSDFLIWITSRLGPMPYGSELRLAGAPTAWLGFEHPANIVLHEELADLSLPYADAAMHVTMHEIVHQWSGDRVTLATAQDFAWKEAIAEYLSYVFEDESRPPGEAEASRAYWDSISTESSHYVRPTDEPPPAVEDFYGTVYGPGPMILFIQLEPFLGRETILSAIAAFLDGGGARSVADLQVALEQASGADLEPYFSTWVFGAGPPPRPSFAIDTVDNGDGTVTVTATQLGSVVFPCRLEVEISGATLSALVELDFGLESAIGEASVTIPFAEAVASTSIDPEHRLVDASVGVAPPVWPVYVF